MSEETFGTILPSHYRVDRDKLEITLIDGTPVALENFKELATIIPKSYKLELTNGKAVIMPVHALTGQRESLVQMQVTQWCVNNSRLVGIFGNSNTCYYLPLPAETIKGSDSSVVLSERWGVLTRNDQNQAFPPVAPNFVAEVRSDSQSEDFCHEKMCMWMNAGVEEGLLIDPIRQTVTTYRIQGNDIIWTMRRNPHFITSRVLNGFVLNMAGII